MHGAAGTSLGRSQPDRERPGMDRLALEEPLDVLSQGCGRGVPPRGSFSRHFRQIVSMSRGSPGRKIRGETHSDSITMRQAFRWGSHLGTAGVRSGSRRMWPRVRRHPSPARRHGCGLRPAPSHVRGEPSGTPVRVSSPLSSAIRASPNRSGEGPDLRRSDIPHGLTGAAASPAKPHGRSPVLDAPDFGTRNRSPDRITLLGLMSRWRTPRSCACWTASLNEASTRAASRGVTGSVRALSQPDNVGPAEVG